MFPDEAHPDPQRTSDSHLPDEPSQRVGNPTDGGGVAQAVHVDGIVTLATDAGIAVEMAPAVGEFVATGATMFRVYGNADLGRRRDSSIGSRSVMNAPSARTRPMPCESSWISH